MTTRLLCPSSRNGSACTVNGRTYACTPSTAIDVPDFDADALCANGYVKVAAAGVGTTAQRPANPKNGDEYHDTTLGKNVVFHAGNWRDPATGNAA